MLKLNLSNLKQSFSVSRYIQLKDDVRLPNFQTLRAQWVVSRSLCLYNLFDLSDVAKKHRVEALQLRISRWSPFTQTATYIVWDQAIAMVWAWDQEATQHKTTDLGIQVIEALPETALYPKHQEAHLALASIDQGHIYQIWYQGILIAEKHSKNALSARAWLQFIRGLNLPPSIKPTAEKLQELSNTPPEISSPLELAPRPWSSSNKIIPLMQSLQWEKWTIISAFTVIFILFLWNLTATLLTSSALSNVEARIAIASEKISTVLDAREKAVKSNADLKQLLRYIDLPQQRAMMAAIGQVLDTQNGQLKEWAYNLNKLDLIIAGENIKTLELLKSLEQLKFIKSASLESTSQPNQHKFALTLRAHYAE
jgi:hypothetical protein